MAASIEDFAKRLIRTNRKITFLFTEDFFNVVGPNGFMSDRYKDIRRAIMYVHHRKGEKAEQRAADPTKLFDVEVVIIRRNFMCYLTTFEELSSDPFGDGALVPGFGTEIIDADKAKILVNSFFARKEEEPMLSITNMLAERRKRQLVFVAESQADFKRPSLEPIIALRNRLTKILINPTKGPIVDCQVASIYKEGNSNSFSSLMNHFCVLY